MRMTRLLALTVLATCLLPPLAAQAGSHPARGSYLCKATSVKELRSCPRYKVTYDGAGSYSWHLNTGPGPNGEAPDDQLATADFTWHVSYQPLILLAPAGTQQSFADAPNGVQGQWSFAESYEGGSCASAGTLVPFDNPELDGTSKHGLHFTLRAGSPQTVDPGDPQSGCHIGDFWQEWLYGTSDIGADAPDALASFVDITKSQLKHKKKLVFETSNVTPRAPSLAPPSDCSYAIDGSCEQSFSWSGQVTVRKRIPRPHNRP